MRTVYLPSANTDAMMLKIESLQVQHIMFFSFLSFMSLFYSTTKNLSHHVRRLVASSKLHSLETFSLRFVLACRLS